MGDFMSRLKSFITHSDDDYEDYDEYEEEDLEEEDEEEEPAQIVQNTVSTVAATTSPTPKLVPLSQTTRMEILTFKLINYNMTGDVFNYIKAKKPVIVDMVNLEKLEKQRALDFLSGACSALNGSVDKLAENLYIFAPENVNINQEKTKVANNNNLNPLI